MVSSTTVPKREGVRTEKERSGEREGVGTREKGRGGVGRRGERLQKRGRHLRAPCPPTLGARDGLDVHPLAARREVHERPVRDRCADSRGGFIASYVHNGHKRGVAAAINGTAGHIDVEVAQEVLQAHAVTPLYWSSASLERVLELDLR